MTVMSSYVLIKMIKYAVICCVGFDKLKANMQKLARTNSHSQSQHDYIHVRYFIYIHNADIN